MQTPSNSINLISDKSTMFDTISMFNLKGSYWRQRRPLRRHSRTSMWRNIQPSPLPLAAVQRESTEQDVAVLQKVSSGMPELATSLCAFKRRKTTQYTHNEWENLVSTMRSAFTVGVAGSAHSTQLLFVPSANVRMTTFTVQASYTRANTFSHVSSMLLGMRSSVKIEPPTQTV